MTLEQLKEQFENGYITLVEYVNKGIVILTEGIDENDSKAMREAHSKLTDFVFGY